MERLRHMAGWAAALGVFVATGALDGAPATDGAFRAPFTLPLDPFGGFVWTPQAYGGERYAEIRDWTGEDWFVLEDRIHGTVRFAFPRTPVPLWSDDVPQTSAGILDGIFGFFRATQHLFGVDPDALEEAAVRPLGENHFFAAWVQREGIRVRGASVQAEVDAAGRLVWLRAAFPGELPPVELPRLSEKEALKAAGQAGFTDPLSALLQIGFPEGDFNSPRAIWSITGLDPNGHGGELVLDAVTGEVLAARDLRLFFEVSGKVEGIFPDRTDVFAMPFEFDPARPQPVRRIYVEGVIPGDREVRRTETDDNGEYRLFLPLEELEDPKHTLIEFRTYLKGATFNVHPASQIPGPSPVQETVREYASVFPSRVDFFFNEQLEEYRSALLHVSEHIVRAREAISYFTKCGLGIAQLAEIELGSSGVEAGDVNMQFNVVRDRFTYYYDKVLNQITIGSDEINPRDPVTRRWRKVVPTIVYHEYAHYAMFILTLQLGDVQAHEGFADALAAYIAGTSKLGFTRDGLTAEPDFPDDLALPGKGIFARGLARDLAEDKLSWPGDERRLLAGALWDLWAQTANERREEDPPLQEDDPGGAKNQCPKADLPDPYSTFAFSSVLRWLLSYGSSSSTLHLNDNAGQTFWLHPFTGYEFFLFAHRAYTTVEHEDIDIYDFAGLEPAKALFNSFGTRNLHLLPFRRGDANGSGSIDLADAVTIFAHLFQGRPNDCLDALDTDNSGELDITDGIYLLRWLFQGGPEPPPPSRSCGWDLPAEPSGTFDALGCGASECSPFPWWAQRP